MLEFFRSTIPVTAGYMFVLPGPFGTDTGIGPRLRYELYPRRYAELRFSTGESAIRQRMTDDDLAYVVVPALDQYPTTSWLREGRSWLQRIDFDVNTCVLAAVSQVSV